LAIAKFYAAIASGSLAVLSSLVDSLLDLTSQGLFWYTDIHMHTPNVKYPAGRRRLEPIAVIVSATLMGIAGTFVEVFYHVYDTFFSY
jgi:divalent metal cation (Fe/Co/Zn/Cd) transporter